MSYITFAVRWRDVPLSHIYMNTLTVKPWFLTRWRCENQTHPNFTVVCVDTNYEDSQSITNKLVQTADRLWSVESGQMMKRPFPCIVPITAIPDVMTSNMYAVVHTIGSECTFHQHIVSTCSFIRSAGWTAMDELTNGDDKTMFIWNCKHVSDFYVSMLCSAVCFVAFS